MSRRVDFHIDELEQMRKYPDELFYRGKRELLGKLKLSIVGTRKPCNYTKIKTQELASKLARVGVCIVSGAAMGVDAIAHDGAGHNNTIAVLGNGLDIRYPATNKAAIESIESNGLLLSPFKDGFRSTLWSFVVRNEIVVALGDVLIVTEADKKSGSLRSVEYALKMGKKIFVLPHRLGESEGTNALLKESKAELIMDIDEFVSRFGTSAKCIDDPFLQFCQTNPTYEEAVRAYPQEVFTYELEGKIAVSSGKIVIR